VTLANARSARSGERPTITSAVGGTRAILRERDDHVLYILFDRRRVFEIVVDSTLVDC
jgi:hypothetical protein